MLLDLRKRARKLGAFATLTIPLLLLTGCAVDTQSLQVNIVSGVSQAVLDALLAAFSSYLAGS